MPDIYAREYFAAHASLETFIDDSGSIAEAVAAELMQSPPPDPTKNTIRDCMKWWALAEARLRFFVADAMLEASKEPPCQ